MGKVEDAKYRCDVCGTITYKPYDAKFSVAMKTGGNLTKDFQICESCLVDANKGNTIFSWFKKFWSKK